VGYYDTPDYANGVTVSGDYAYVADFRGGLRIISVGDPEHPEEVGYCDTPGYAYDVTVSGGYAYVADNESGLRVINVADPEHPYEVGYYDTPGVAYGVALSEDGLIYVADFTNVGIYRFTDPAVVDDSFILHPSAFILHPAYPNPFNSTTTIRYSLDRDAFITLNLYNLAGREIASLVNEKQSVGNYQTIWNAEAMSSGVYLLRLEAEGEVSLRKLVLVR